MTYRFLYALVAAAALAGCQDDSGAGREARQTQLNQNQASTIVGMPAITNFTEKRQLKTIYELRDSANLVTYSYFLDLNGKRHKVCPSTSVGFGIPYAAQYTAPKSPRITYPLWPNGEASSSGHAYDAEQPEPNGLYMPASAEGTWILCLSPNGKDLAPTYVEPRVMVYLFEMSSVD